MSRQHSLANQTTAEYLKSIRASQYSPRKATLAVHVTTTRHPVQDCGLPKPQARTRVHEKNDGEMNDQQPQEPFYAHETWSSAAVVAGRPRDDDRRIHPILDQLRKQKQYSTGFEPSRGDRSRRKRSDQASTTSSRKEVRFKLASVAEDEEPEPKPDEHLRQQRSKNSPGKIETVNVKPDHTKSEHTKSEHIKLEHSKAEHGKLEHNESPRKKKSKHPKEASPSESSSSPSKSSPSARTIPLAFPILPEIAPLEPLYVPTLQPEYDTPPLVASSRIPPIHPRPTKAAPMEPIFRMPVQPLQYPPSAAAFSYHTVAGRRRQAGLGTARDEFVPIYRAQPDHRAYVAFEPAPVARFTDMYHWR